MPPLESASSANRMPNPRRGEARIGTPEEFPGVLDQQARQWKTVIEETGIKMESRRPLGASSTP